MSCTKKKNPTSVDKLTIKANKKMKKQNMRIAYKIKLPQLKKTHNTHEKIYKFMTIYY